MLSDLSDDEKSCTLLYDFCNTVDHIVSYQELP